MLRLFGAKVAAQARIAASARIVMPWNLDIGEWSAIGPEAFVYNLGKVRIGRRATVSYRSHICAGSHDFTDPTIPLTKPPVNICDDAWVGTEAFIGPGVTIGAGAMVGARSVVVKDVEPRMIVAGHPARVVGERPAMRRRDAR